jgi:drug/metabolite transporter (DMT)-like permease
VIAVLGGLGAAVAWAAATLSSTRASRLLGPGSTLAWVMLVGLAVAGPLVLVAGGDPPGRDDLGWLVAAGVGNVVGLGFQYAGLRRGKVGVVAPITSTEGAIAAVFAVVLGEEIAPGVGAALAVVAIGVPLAAASREDGAGWTSQGVGFAIVAALSFGVGLYAAGRVGESLAIAWAILPARLLGVVAVAAPLAATRRLRLTRLALPFVVLSGLAEIAGFASFAAGARHGIAISSVLASQFAGLAAIGAFLIFRERLARIQVAGVALIAAGVAAVSALQA